MTNYNKRLTTELVKLQGRAIKDWESDLAEAKQALTSLFKELVAEAKPEDNCMGCNGVNKFEQNLLKALEELN